jgi:hypothetical protein
VGASGNPALPSEMTLVFRLLAGENTFRSMLERFSLIEPQAVEYSVTGTYRTPSGTGGTVEGFLDGPLAGGTFSGTLTADFAGCTAQREFAGPLNEASLQWTGGRTLHDCKDSPLGFNTLTLVRGDTNLPPTTTVPTTTAPACTYGLNPGGASIGLPGGSGSIEVVTQPGCGWSAQSFVPWVTVSPASGAAGPGRVQYTVEATSTPRQATLIIANLPFVLRQEPPTTTTTTTSSTTTSVGTTSTSTSSSTTTSSTTTSSTTSSTSTTTTTSTCNYSLNPTSANLDFREQDTFLNIVTQSGCGWTIGTGSFPPWIVVTSPSSTNGNGPAAVTLHVFANTDTSTGQCATRTANLPIANNTFTVNQTNIICSGVRTLRESRRPSIFL